MADENAASVFVYPALGSSTGLLNKAPIATISGSKTGLDIPAGIAVDSSGNIYVADRATPRRFPRSPRHVFVYPPGSNGNETPTATISGPQTELGNPQFIAIQPVAGATPTLAAAPAAIKFGNVDATGTSKPEKVTLTNKGTTAAVIGSVTATPPFVVAGGENTCSGQSIEPKKKCSFEVEFAPATPGAVSNATIEVAYNGASPAMSLSGTGIAVTLNAPSKETFSSVAAGATGKAKKIKISNPATVSVNLGYHQHRRQRSRRVHDNGQQLHGHAGGQRQLHDRRWSSRRGAARPARSRRRWGSVTHTARIPASYRSRSRVLSNEQVRRKSTDWRDRYPRRVRLHAGDFCSREDAYGGDLYRAERSRSHHAANRRERSHHAGGQYASRSDGGQRSRPGRRQLSAGASVAPVATPSGTRTGPRSLHRSVERSALAELPSLAHRKAVWRALRPGA